MVVCQNVNGFSWTVLFSLLSLYDVWLSIQLSQAPQGHQRAGERESAMAQADAVGIRQGCWLRIFMLAKLELVTISGLYYALLVSDKKLN